MRLRTRRPQLILEAPLASMGDIAFQLIIFFMVAATFATATSLNIELPNASDEKAQEQDNTITVQASQSALAVNEAPVEPTDLVAHLAGILVERDENDRIVVLLTADDVTFQRNAELMLAIRQASGVVALMYEEEE